MSAEIGNDEVDSRPLRIGIWADYQDASQACLQANRVWLANLIPHLLEQGPTSSVVLLVSPDDVALASASAGQARLSVRPDLTRFPRWPPFAKGSLLAHAIRAWAQVAASVQLRRLRTGGLSRSLVARGRSLCRRVVTRLVARTGARRQRDWLVLGLAALTAPLAFAAIWAGYAAFRLLDALACGLCLPLAALDGLARHYHPDRRHPIRESYDAVAEARAAACDVWLVPSPILDHALDLPFVLAIPDTPCSDMEWKPILLQRVREATLCVSSSPPATDLLLEECPELPPEKFRTLTPATPAEEAARWLALLREAVDRAATLAAFDRRPLAPWPACAPGTATRTPELLLLLQRPVAGARWETTRDLVHHLFAINQERGQLALTLAVHDQQHGLTALDVGPAPLRIEPLRFHPVSRREAVGMLGGSSSRLDARPEGQFAFVSGAGASALNADAWLVLDDFFPLPLLPARPYAVLVQEAASRTSERGRGPTLRAAEEVLVTSPQTADTVRARYDVAAHQLRLVPIFCEPGRRFGALAPVAVPLIEGPFILGVGDGANDERTDLLLRAHEKLRLHLGGKAPGLVLCSRGPTKLVSSPGDGVTLLGAVTAAQLADLYHRCQAIVPVGCWTALVEAAYFGRPAIAARSAEVSFLSERFGIPVQVCQTGDAADLALTLARTCQRTPATAREIEQMRQQLHDPEFSARRFAERVYDSLVTLARDARQSHPAGTRRRSA